MKTSNTHPHHGITFPDNGQGWFIQIKLLGKHRMIKAETSDADTAARRFDLALFKLEAFTHAGATPNFPADFSALTLNLGDDAPQDEKDFVVALRRWHKNLCEEVMAVGGDVEELLINRSRAAVGCQERKESNRLAARGRVQGQLDRAEAGLLQVGLTPESYRQAKELMTSLRNILRS